MTPHLFPLATIAGLVAAGVFLLLERNLTRMLLGMLLISNAVNLLIIHGSGPAGNPPVLDSSAGKETAADPLAAQPQVDELTASFMTNTPEKQAMAYNQNVEFWVENYELLGEKWAEFVAGN